MIPEITRAAIEMQVGTIGIIPLASKIL
jgi:hypothetical protein